MVDYNTMDNWKR